MFPLAPPQATLKFSGNKINCFPLDQSLSVGYSMMFHFIQYYICVIVLSTGEIPELEGNKAEVHSVASVLKSYFRELPEPLIPYDYFEVFLTAARCEYHMYIYVHL